MLVVVGMVVGMVVGCERREEVRRAVGVREDGVMEVKVMSFNIRYENAQDEGVRAWASRVVGVVGAVRGEGVDVLGMQEGLHGQVADLRASLSEYDFAGVGRDDGRRGGEYAGIFFRRDRFEKDEGRSGMIWLSETPEVAGSKSWGNEITRMASWVRLVDRVSGRVLWVVNLHLDHRSQESKERGVRLMVERLVGLNGEGDAVVWMGDFNATEGNEVIRFLGGRDSKIPRVEGFAGFVETYAEGHPRERVPGSVNFWRSDPKLQWKLDYIFVSKGGEVVEARVMRTEEPYLSDHFPVVARVRWR